jgi:putative glutamine amidotransferase
MSKNNVKIEGIAAPAKNLTCKPRIAINIDVKRGRTTNYLLNRAYIQAILNSGGIPIIIPPMKQKDMIAMLRQCDGVMLIGGPDYHPSNYGEEALPDPILSLLDKEREEFDFRFIKHVIKRTKLPVLGICGGLQLINIYFGGTLVQDLETTFPGRGEEHRSEIKQPHAEHPVHLLWTGKMRHIYGKSILPSTVSSHHQCIKIIGKDLNFEGFAPDGTPEALSHFSRPYLFAVQWHPEQDYQANKKLFKSLISAARKYRQQMLNS